MSAILPAIRSALQPAIRAVYGSSSAWSPLTLFAASEKGVWYDPSDFSTLFQDSAGTTPVTAVGDPVGKILDKSGNGKHATQATAASRPILRHDGTNYYLEFDGVDDSLATAAIDFSATQLLSFFAGIRKIGSSAASGVLTELTASSANLGSFSIFAPNSGTESYLFIANGGAGTGYIATTYTAPITNVIACNYNLAANSNELKVIPRINGATPGTLTVAGGVPAGGAQTFANAAMYIGRRGGTTLPLNGRIYSLIVLGRTATALEIAAAESYAAGKSGVVLP